MSSHLSLLGNFSSLKGERWRLTHQKKMQNKKNMMKNQDPALTHTKEKKLTPKIKSEFAFCSELCALFCVTTMDAKPWINPFSFFPFHQPSVASRAMRRVSSVPSRAQSPSYVISTGVSPSRGSLRTSLGSGFGSPSVTDSRPLNPSAYSSTTLPAQRAASPYSAQRPASPTAVRRIASVTSRQTSNPNGPTPQYQTTTRVGSPLTLTDAQTRVASPSQGQVESSSPKRSGMTAVPQHLGPSLQRTVHDMEQFGQQQYDIYERMVPPRPDSLTGEYKLTALKLGWAE